MSTLEQASSIDPPSLFGRAVRAHARSIHARQLIPGAAWLAVAETALALAMLGTVVGLANLSAIERINNLLATRVTLGNVFFLVAFAAAWPWIFRACGLYQPAFIRDRSEEGARVAAASSLGAMLPLMLTASGGLTAVQLFAFWALTVTGTIGLRHARRAAIPGRVAPKRVLFVGSGTCALRMWQRLARDPQTKYDVAGFVDTAEAIPANEEILQRSIGTLDQLERLLMHDAIDEVHIALPVKSHYPEIQQTIRICERVGVRAKYRADLFDSEVAWPRYDEPGSPVVTMHVVPDDYRLALKRAVDVVGAALLLILLAPLIAAAAALVKVTSRGPVFFAQERYGLNRRRFRMFKFRTMVADAERLQALLEDRNEVEGPVFKIADDPRVTPVGRWLRRASIDELPQLINVLRGEMSLVGPRPLPLRDVGRFTNPADMRRFSVRPGLTCLWQVSGRSRINFSEWVRLDLKYIDGWSLWLDVLILLRTVPAVLRGTGAE